MAVEEAATVETVGVDIVVETTNMVGEDMVVEEEIRIETVTVDMVVGESKTVEADMMVETADMMGEDMVVEVDMEGEEEATTVETTVVENPSEEITVDMDVKIDQGRGMTMEEEDMEEDTEAEDMVGGVVAEAGEAGEEVRKIVRRRTPFN